ncbi:MULTISPECIES: hypothetical protein [unclassified Anabaena]|uniref:hypothetical protein n=1 Tax=unclassified Anabaena TaxID=2619674 RepID=UPI001447F965|nr:MULTISPECIES: hypothetical protein [unclassified Anabaena]MTJ08203.1 hypothetical protein [Anabaena sp. UHCC 0204]MTJ53436.1 hypothetical protein [Anabaena sp. UHCC 0253]
MDNEQELQKKIDARKTSGNIFKRYPGIWFLSLFLIPIGVTIFAYYQLIYIGYVPQKQQEETPFIPVQSTISTFSDSSNPIPIWLVISVIFCCATGSFVIFYLLQNSRNVQKSHQRIRHSQKLNFQNRNKPPNCPSPPTDKENLLIILPPEKIYPLNTNTASFRNLLNIYTGF